MNNYYINYFFNKESLKRLDDKYLSNITLDDNILYLYSNSIEFSKFFVLTNPFLKYLNVIDYFNTDPKTLFDILINYIIKNGYKKDDITLLYSLSNYYILMNSEKLKNISYLSDLKFFNLNTKKYIPYKYFKEGHIYKAYTLNTLKTVISNSYHIYNYDKLLSISLRNFNKFYNHNFLMRLRYYLFKPFSKNLKSLGLKKGINTTDIDLSEDLDKSYQLLELINEKLYYHKDENYNKYFKGVTN